MDTYVQERRLLQIDTDLGKDHINLVSAEGEDRISSCFSYDLELTSADPLIRPEQLLGRPATIWFNGIDQQRISVNGLISRFSIAGKEARDLCLYRACLVPSLWFLTRTSDCRIFQDQNVREIVDTVLTEYGIQNRQWTLRGNHDKRDYCVQYCETAYDFICRLLEEEGICFYFRHDATSHTIIFSDDNHGLPSTRLIVPIVDKSERNIGIWQWQENYQIRSGQWALSDFNFETPSTSLLTQTKTINPVLSKQALEMYHFPGRYQKQAPGADLTKLRIEYEEAAFQEITGSSNRTDFAAGTCFSLANGDKAPADQQFVLTAVHHTARDWSVATQDDRSTYTNRFYCLPRTLPYRPPMKTQRPCILGTQTAIVTGPPGAEICTDRYGRIKVQFHWDRYGKHNDHSSCWIRVAQSWAGRGWGSWTLPRIGQEVVVSFLEGDPDRPLVVGSVYNAEQTVPFSLPANATQTGLRTRSSMGGSAANCNELRFEDKKGSEQVYFHAERNLDSSIELNESHSVGADQSFTVGHDRTKSIARDETTQVGRDRTETVGRNETVTVALLRTHTVGVSDTLTVGAARVHSVGATEAITVGASQTTSIGKNSSLSVGENQTISVGGNETVSVGKDRSTSISQGETLDVGKTITISAGEQIMLQTGSAKLTMLKNGDITIEGNQITIKGSGNVVIKGQKILQN